MSEHSQNVTQAVEANLNDVSMTPPAIHTEPTIQPAELDSGKLTKSGRAVNGALAVVNGAISYDLLSGTVQHIEKFGGNPFDPRIVAGAGVSTYIAHRFAKGAGKRAKATVTGNQPEDN